jgi:hypothetical protein
MGDIGNFDTRIAEAEQELATLQAEAAAAQKHKWFIDSMNVAIRKHTACVHMLSDIRDIGCGIQHTNQRRTSYAEFKGELSALAKEYGYKIVLVGDKQYGCVAAV